MKRLFDNRRLPAVQSKIHGNIRVLSLLLGIAILLTMLPQMVLFAVDAVGQGITVDFGKSLGCTATFCGHHTTVSDAPETPANNGATVFYSAGWPDND